MVVTIDGATFDLLLGTYVNTVSFGNIVITDEEERGFRAVDGPELDDALNWGTRLWTVNELSQILAGILPVDNERNPFVTARMPRRVSLKEMDRYYAPAKIEVPNLPVIPEVNDAGQRRLPLTRYKALEKRYLEIVKSHNSVIDLLTSAWDKQDEIHKREIQATQELANLKAVAVDSETVNKKLNAVVKELRLPVKLGGYKTMEQRLNAFFGSLLASCRVNSNEPDEIAE